MPFIGQLIYLKVCCPWCAVPGQQQARVSDFFTLRCTNEECESFGQEVLIERRTGEIIAANVRQYKTFDGKTYRQMWEEVKE